MYVATKAVQESSFAVYVYHETAGRRALAPKGGSCHGREVQRKTREKRLYYSLENPIWTATPVRIPGMQKIVCILHTPIKPSSLGLKKPLGLFQQEILGKKKSVKCTTVAQHALAITMGGGSSNTTAGEKKQSTALRWPRVKGDVSMSAARTSSGIEENKREMPSASPTLESCAFETREEI